MSQVNVRNGDDIEHAVTAFAQTVNGDLIVAASGSAAVHRKLIISLAARHKLPTVYYRRRYVTDGGLISYGPDFIDQYQRAAGYVDRVLRREKADRAASADTGQVRARVNLKTAKALGLTIRPSLLAQADAAIE